MDHVCFLLDLACDVSGDIADGNDGWRSIVLYLVDKNYMNEKWNEANYRQFVRRSRIASDHRSLTSRDRIKAVAIVVVMVLWFLVVFGYAVGK